MSNLKNNEINIPEKTNTKRVFIAKGHTLPVDLFDDIDVRDTTTHWEETYDGNTVNSGEVVTHFKQWSIPETELSNTTVNGKLTIEAEYSFDFPVDIITLHNNPNIPGLEITEALSAKIKDCPFIDDLISLGYKLSVTHAEFNSDSALSNVTIDRNLFVKNYIGVNDGIEHYTGNDACIYRYMITDNKNQSFDGKINNFWASSENINYCNVYMPKYRKFVNLHIGVFNEQNNPLIGSSDGYLMYDTNNFSTSKNEIYGGLGYDHFASLFKTPWYIETDVPLSNAFVDIEINGINDSFSNFIDVILSTQLLAIKHNYSSYGLFSLYYPNSLDDHGSLQLISKDDFGNYSLTYSKNLMMEEIISSENSVLSLGMTFKYAGAMLGLCVNKYTKDFDFNDNVVPYIENKYAASIETIDLSAVVKTMYEFTRTNEQMNLWSEFGSPSAGETWFDYIKRFDNSDNGDFHYSYMDRKLCAKYIIAINEIPNTIYYNINNFLNNSYYNGEYAYCGEYNTSGSEYFDNPAQALNDAMSIGMDIDSDCIYGVSSHDPNTPDMVENIIANTINALYDGKTTNYMPAEIYCVILKANITNIPEEYRDAYENYQPNNN